MRAMSLSPSSKSSAPRASCSRSRRREQTVADLVALTDLAPASVSEHLKVLRKSGLLILRPDGGHRYHRTDPDVVRGAAADVRRLIASPCVE